jgi:hypothetical protein
MTTRCLQSLFSLKTWSRKNREVQWEKREEARESTLSQLRRVFKEVTGLDKIRLDSAVTDTLPIVLESIGFDEEAYAPAQTPCFFRPLTQGELDARTLDLEHASTNETFTQAVEYYDSEEHHSRDSDDGADSMNTDLQGLFMGCKRIVPDDIHRTLRQLSEWIPG